VNEELRRLYEADQADRTGDGLPSDLRERDRARRQRVTELLDAGAAETGEDHHHAAMVLQHGEDLADYLRAHELALRSADLGYRRGRWLAAAAYDRWLMHQGRPQKYGTQYRGTADGYELYEVDPATTDEERAEWNVPPLAEARRRAADMQARWPIRQPAVTPAASLKVGDLELGVFVFAARTQPPPKMPDPTPFEDGDPVPAWLPPGLTPVRQAQGFGAVDEAGELRVAWHRPAAPMLLGWREEDGPPPQPEAVELRGSTGIACRSALDGWEVLLVGRRDGQRWMVAGRCSREDLVRVAESLP